MEIVVYLITALAAYLLGSIPSGYLAGRAKGIDIRAVGSGNIGATNAFRILGKTAGALVLVADGLKGWVAVALVPELACKSLLRRGADRQRNWNICASSAGVGVILGHNYPCWLKFKGGKGIATSAGVLAALVPWAFVISLAIWMVVCRFTRYVSVASICAAAALPFATWLGASLQRMRMMVVTALMSALAIYKHKGNITRLMNGTENKMGRKKPRPPATGGIS